MKYPPLHTSPEAVRLRQAARAWLEAADKDGLDHSPGCVHELAASKAHHEFLEAAIAYGTAVAAAKGNITTSTSPLNLLKDFLPPTPPLHRIITAETLHGEKNPLVGPMVDLITNIPIANEEKPAKRWRCKICKRDKFTRPTAHTCIGGYRKHNLKWEIVGESAPEEAASERATP